MLPLIQNWSVVQWLAIVPWPYTVDDMSWFIENVAGPRATTPDPIFTLLLDGKTPIGVAECTGGTSADAAQETKDDLDLGFWIGEPYWGKGYMSETVAALIDRSFFRPETDIIRSGVFDGNGRSLRLHERLGFLRTGTRMSNCRSRNTLLPLTTLRLARAQWLLQKQTHFRP